jgi:alkylated DNA repair dioxygenase AlkB
MTTTIHTAQGSLFDPTPGLPVGLAYEPAFITPDEEQALIDVIAALPLREARYKEYTARRRVYAFGSRFDFDAYRLQPQPIGVLPQPLGGLRERLAAWAGIAPEDFVHVMVSEYAPGTPLGWHRDAPDYERIVGVSLGSAARLRFRPWPPRAPKKDDILTLELAPRSAYRLALAARWAWQHSVPPVPALRWSVTMRTARDLGADAQPLRPPAASGTPALRARAVRGT